MNPSGNRAARNFYSLARGASLLGAVVGAAGLLGWCLSLDALKSVFPDLATMKASTALDLGISRALGRKSRAPVRSASRSADLYAFAAALIAGLTVFEYASGRAELATLSGYAYDSEEDREPSHDQG